MGLRLLALLFVAATPVSAQPFIVAHRGASADAPENTLPAFKLAWLQGADAIEGDFHLTSDGHIVCHHDANTRKRAKQDLVLAKATLAQVRALDVGAWKEEKWKGTRIPTLTEVLDTIPADGEFFLEVKCGPEIVGPMLEILDGHAIAEEKVTIISFNRDVIAATKKARPALRANWLCSFKERSGQVTPEVAKVMQDLTDCQADGLSTNSFPGIDENFVARVHKLGCSHHVWTVDDAPTAHRFLKLGSVTVTTNRPGALRAELAK